MAPTFSDLNSSHVTLHCHSTCSKSLQHDECNAGQLRATHQLGKRENAHFYHWIVIGSSNKCHKYTTLHFVLSGCKSPSNTSGKLDEIHISFGRTMLASSSLANLLPAGAEVGEKRERELKYRKSGQFSAIKGNKTHHQKIKTSLCQGMLGDQRKKSLTENILILELKMIHFGFVRISLRTLTLWNDVKQICKFNHDIF